MTKVTENARKDRQKMSEAEKEEENWMLSDQNTECKLDRRRECLARVDIKRILRSAFLSIRASIF